jgi:hypothetical protein
MDELFVRIDDLETGISDTPAITLQSCAVQIRLALSEHERQGALGDLGLAALRQAVASLDTLAAKQPDDDTVSKLSNARSKSSRSAARSWKLRPMGSRPIAPPGLPRRRPGRAPPSPHHLTADPGAGCGSPLSFCDGGHSGRPAGGPYTGCHQSPD